MKLTYVRHSLAAAMAAAVSAAPAYAAVNTQTTTFLVKATVSSNCTIAATNLDFGTYDPTGTSDLPGQSTVTVNCTNGTAWNVGLDEGTFAGATVTARTMTGPGSYSLNYALYRDASHTLNWGDTVGTDTKSGTGNGADQVVNVYGLAAHSQNVGAGDYQDTITATITF